MDTDIGFQIKEARKKQGLTQKQLAKALNKSERMIQKYESNDVTPSFDILKQISTILKTDIMDLVLSNALDNIDKTLKDNDLYIDISKKYSKHRKKQTSSDEFELFDLKEYFFNSVVDIFSLFHYSKTFNYSLDEYDPLELDEISDFLTNVFLLKLDEIIKRHENDKFKKSLDIK